MTTPGEIVLIIETADGIPPEEPNAIVKINSLFKNQGTLHAHIATL